MNSQYFNKEEMKNSSFESRYKINEYFLDLLQSNPEDKIFEEHLLFLSHTLCKDFDTIDYVLISSALDVYEGVLKKRVAHTAHYIDILEMKYAYLKRLSSVVGIFSTNEPYFQFHYYFNDISKYIYSQITNMKNSEPHSEYDLEAKYNRYWQYSDVIQNKYVLEITEVSSHTQEQKREYLATLQVNLEKYSQHYIEIYCAYKATYAIASFDSMNIMQSVLVVQNMIASLFESIEPYKFKFSRMYNYILKEGERMGRVLRVNSNFEPLKMDNPYYDCRFTSEKCAKLYLENQNYDWFFETYYDKKNVEKILVNELKQMYKLDLISLQYYRYVVELGIFFNNEGACLQDKLRHTYWLLVHTDKESEPNIFLLNSLNVVHCMLKLKQKTKANKWLDLLLPMIHAIDLSKVNKEIMWGQNETINELEDTDIRTILEVLYTAHRYEDFEKFFLNCEACGIFENSMVDSSLKLYIKILKSKKNREDVIKVYEKKLRTFDLESTMEKLQELLDEEELLSIEKI